MRNIKISLLLVLVSFGLFGCQSLFNSSSSSSANNSQLKLEITSTVVNNDATAPEDYYLESSYGLYGQTVDGRYDRTYIPGVADAGGSRICMGNNKLIFATPSKVFWITGKLGGKCEYIWEVGSNYSVYALAADTANNVFFVDWKTNNIYKITQADGLIASVISSNVRYQDIDINDKIYLLASQAKTVDIYDVSGVTYTKSSSITLSDADSKKMVVDNNKNVYVLYNTKVKVYNYVSGQYTAGSDINFSNAGEQGKELGVDNIGDVYVLSQTPTVNSRYKTTIVKYKISNTKLMAKFEIQQIGLPDTVHMAIDSEENAYVLTKTEYADAASCIDLLQSFSKNKELNKFWQIVGPDTAVSTGAGDYNAIAMAPNGNIMLAFSDAGKTRVRTYSNNTWSDLGGGYINDSGDYNSLAVALNGDVYVAFRDKLDEKQRVRVKKYSNSVWSDVGYISGGMGYSISMVVTLLGDVVVAFKDDAYGSQTRVRRYSTNGWSDVGANNGLVSIGEGSDNSLAIAANGDFVLAFSDVGVSYQTRVLRYSSSTNTWSSLGSISGGAGSYQSVAIASNGDIIVAFKDAGCNNRVRVRKYSNGAWSDVGSDNGCISTGVGSSIAMVLTSVDDVVVAFKDAGVNSRSRVRKYSNNVWTDLGSDSGCISTGAGAAQALTVNSADEIIAAFKDSIVSNKIRVKKFVTEKLL